MRLACLCFFGAVVAGSACGGDDRAQINCDNLCARTLACNVTFAPDDDLELAKVASGERSEAESCALGCADSVAITVDKATCIDGLTITGDAAACEDDVLTCLELPTS